MALALTRKAGETLVIDERTTITFEKSTRVWINAPSDVSIRRGELEPKTSEEEKGPQTT